MSFFMITERILVRYRLGPAVLYPSHGTMHEAFKILQTDGQTGRIQRVSLKSTHINKHL